MDQAGTRTGHDRSMTLAQLRHDIRNYLNAIKLSSALLQRRHKDELSDESLKEIDRSADCINDLITRFLADSEVRNMMK